VKEARTSGKKEKQETRDTVDFYDWFDALEFKIKSKEEKLLPNGGGK